MINFLSIFLGFDKEYLKSQEGGSWNIFFFAFLYILILSLSMYTCYYAGHLLSDNVIVSVLISLFLTYIMHNMYKLIIATSFEGPNLTSKKKIYKYISEKGFLVIILSTFISSSLCVSIFDSEINIELKNWQADFKQNYENILSSNYEKQIADLKKSYEDEKAFNLLMNTSINLNDSLVLQENLNRIEQKKQSKIESLNMAIMGSNFFIQRVIIISGHPKFWLITILTVMLFLLPLYIFNRSAFFLNYQLYIINNSNKLILVEYNNFKDVYKNIIASATGQEIPYRKNERYEDPPFNTKPKTRKDKILQKGSLLEWIKKYHG